MEHNTESSRIAASWILDEISKDPAAIDAMSENDLDQTLAILGIDVSSLLTAITNDQACKERHDALDRVQNVSVTSMTESELDEVLDVLGIDTDPLLSLVQDQFLVPAPKDPDDLVQERRGQHLVLRDRDRVCEISDEEVLQRAWMTVGSSGLIPGDRFREFAAAIRAARRTYVMSIPTNITVCDTGLCQWPEQQLNHSEGIQVEWSSVLERFDCGGVIENPSTLWSGLRNAHDRHSGRFFMSYACERSSSERDGSARHELAVGKSGSGTEILAGQSVPLGVALRRSMRHWMEHLRLAITGEVAQCFREQRISRCNLEFLWAGEEESRIAAAWAVRVENVLPNSAQVGLHDLRQSVTGLVEEVVWTNMRATQELLQLANPGADIELQQRFARECLDALMQGTATLVRATRHTAEEALRPLEQQIEQHREKANQSYPHAAE